MDRSVLATYASERRPVAEQVLVIDKIAAKTAASRQSKVYCSIVQEYRSFTTGFGIAYDPIENNLLLLSSAKPGPSSLKPGMRAPNFKAFQYATGRKTVFSIQPNQIGFPFLYLYSQVT